MHCLFIQAGTAIINISSSSLQWDKAISNEGKHSAPAKAAPSRRLIQYSDDWEVLLLEVIQRFCAHDNSMSGC